MDTKTRSELVTIADLAAMLQVSRRTVERLAASGTLPPPVRIGRLIRFRLEDLQRWMDRGGAP